MQHTRKQYLNHECSHRAYYGQFVTEPVKGRVLICIGTIDLLASTDEHLNDIPLKRWDAIGPVGTKAQWDAAGDYPTMSGRTCVYKEAARQIIEQK